MNLNSIYGLSAYLTREINDMKISNIALEGDLTNEEMLNVLDNKLKEYNDIIDKKKIELISKIKKEEFQNYIYNSDYYHNLTEDQRKDLDYLIQNMVFKWNIKTDQLYTRDNNVPNIFLDGDDCTIHDEIDISITIPDKDFDFFVVHSYRVKYDFGGIETPVLKVLGMDYNNPVDDPVQNIRDKNVLLNFVNSSDPDQFIYALRVFLTEVFNFIDDNYFSLNYYILEYHDLF